MEIEVIVNALFRYFYGELDAAGEKTILMHLKRLNGKNIERAIKNIADSLPSKDESNALAILTSWLHYFYLKYPTAYKVPVYTHIGIGDGFTILEQDGLVAHCAWLDGSPYKHISFCIHNEDAYKGGKFNLYNVTSTDNESFWETYHTIRVEFTKRLKELERKDVVELDVNEMDYAQIATAMGIAHCNIMFGISNQDSEEEREGLRADIKRMQDLIEALERKAGVPLIHAGESREAVPVRGIGTDGYE